MNEENNNEEKKEYQVLNQFKPKNRAVLATSLDFQTLLRETFQQMLFGLMMRFTLRRLVLVSI